MWQSSSRRRSLLPAVRRSPRKGGCRTRTEYQQQRKLPCKQQLQPYEQGRLNKGRLYGVISIVCSILGLGSFGSLDVVAIICGYLGLKSLKAVPNSYPDKATAVTLNRAGIICSAGLIILTAIFIIIALIAFPWIFASIAGFFAGLI